jgi:hypothetical protein
VSTLVLGIAAAWVLSEVAILLLAALDHPRFSGDELSLRLLLGPFGFWH